MLESKIREQDKRNSIVGEGINISDKSMIDEELVHLARNALFVAGVEMGPEGDHWPVIKANIKALMEDYEQLKLQSAAQEELRLHLGDIVSRYESGLEECSPGIREKLAPQIKKLREIYDAMFEPVNPENEVTLPDEGEAPGQYVPWKSSAAIIEAMFTKESENG